MTKRKSTRFIWNPSDIVIKDDGIPDRLKQIIKNAPKDSMSKGEYYLKQLEQGKLSQKELSFILDRGL